jgi:hypothetical protein
MDKVTPAAILEEVATLLGVWIGDGELYDVRTFDANDLGHGLTCECCKRDEIAGHAWRARMDQLQAAASSPPPVELVDLLSMLAHVA